MGPTKRPEQLPVSISLRGDTLNQVSSIKYLGSLVSEDGKCDPDIRVKIGMAKVALGQLTGLAINIRTGVGVLKAYVWSVLLFGCQAWTISNKMRKRLQAAEMWFY